MIAQVCAEWKGYNVSRLFICGLIVFLLSCTNSASEKSLDSAYLQDLALFRSSLKEDQRVKYLALAGRYRLDTGKSLTLGSTASNDIVVSIPDFPAFAGTLFIRGDTLSFNTEDGDSSEQIELLMNPRTESLSMGRFAMHAMNREGNYFLRISDHEDPAIEGFRGYEWFVPDPTMIFEGIFTYFDEARVTEVPSVFDFKEYTEFIGELSFVYQDQTYTLMVGEDGFLMFGDKTTGNESYGSGRYLDLELPDEDGPVRIDFNYAYNPPCIFSKYTTCLFPPAQNRLPFRVTAGEKAEPVKNGDK